MKSSKIKTKKNYGLWVKYFIFNIILFGAFLAVQMNGGESVDAAAADYTYTIQQSNHKGNKNDVSAVGRDSTYYDKWYIQGTGVAMKDVVTVTLELDYMPINGVLAFETGNTTAGGKNYDSYKKVDAVWTSLSTSGYNGTTVLGLAPGKVIADNAGACADLSATSDDLKANKSTGAFYSLMCIAENEAANKITIKYAYTIRNEGYGQKEIIFALYNDATYNPETGNINDLISAFTMNVTFISSKPISEFNDAVSGDVGFTWIDGVNASACDVGVSASGRPETDDICVEYKNSATKTKDPTTMKVIIPKEVAYEHDASILKEDGSGSCTAAGTDDICVSSIKNNTIYARNEFTNVGSEASKYVRYYYYDFMLTDGGYKITGETGYNSDTYNNKINPEQAYFIRISIDALGTYIFTITDIFGNEFTTFDSSQSVAPHVKTGMQVSVLDVSKTEIMIDYTNEHYLTLMKAEGGYPTTNAWRQTWVFSIEGDGAGETYEIDFTKIQADSVEVVAYIFQKIVVENGVYAKNDTDGQDSDTNIEDIAKEPLEFNDGTNNQDYNQFLLSGIQVWRVDASKTDNSTPDAAVTCGGTPASWTDNEKLICINLSSSNFSIGDYSGYDHPTDNTKDILRKNKLVFTVKSNGKYRIKITDTYTNTTDSLTTVGDMKNPSVEVSVIDRTTPIISSDLTGANNTNTGTKPYSGSTSITSWEYVIGGGKLNPVNPLDPDGEDSLTDLLEEEYWKTANYYKTIYYNEGGTKIFNYQDALEIAKIKVVDQTYKYSGTDASTVHAYDVNFGYGAVNNNCFTYNADTSSWGKENSVAGQYCDPSASLKSDRNASGTSYNLHKYIIDENITSFSAGLVKQVGYTNYDAANPGTGYVKIDDKYSAAKNVEFVNEQSAATFLGYLKIAFKTANGEKDICQVTIDANDANDTSNSNNQNCFQVINKYIDEVENFRMVFSTEDYNSKKLTENTYDSSTVAKHASNTYIVDVTVNDTTAPGITMTGADDDNSIEYSNEDTICRLEIDNDIQIKNILLNCYKFTSISGTPAVTTYNFKDNNVKHDASYEASGDEGKKLDSGVQYYTESAPKDYHSKITLEIYEENESWSGWKTIGDDATATGFPHLYKSGYHKFRIRIYDHWDVQHKNEEDGTTNLPQKGNVLTIYGTYYVNPRTLLIEPLANEKMYGQNEPTFDYCVYVNKTNSTFNLEDKFFEVEFVNEYFTYIYCTRDVYAKIETSNQYKQVAGTESKGYGYHTYTQDNAGAYLKVNNTFVKILTENRYKMTMVQNANGEFLLDSSTYYEIKSGYIYTDDKCRYAVTDASIGGNYLRTTSNGCKLIKTDGSNRYTEKYEQDNSGTYLKYNMNTISANGFDNVTGDAKSALVNNNEFTGRLSRLESRCYNTYYSTSNYHSNTDVTGFDSYLTCNENTINATTRNDNVGQYHIVLGTLSIKENTGTAYNKDYVIKINTNYVAKSANIQGPSGTNEITVKHDGVLVDDGLLTESVVNFTIRQAVLTVKANGSSKYFGQHDPYSNVWNTLKTATNNATTGYLGGYEISGWRNNGNSEDSVVGVDDSSYIVHGVLRREVGEEVGIYDICNFNSNPASISRDSCITTPDAPGLYDTTAPYNFAAYDDYAIGGASTVAALTIRVNNDVYGNGAGRTLNTTTRNYAISFIKADFKIEATNLVVQPGINQGKEYAKTPYNDPLWQLVVYGETIYDASGEWKSNIKKSDGADAFNGYTTDIAVNTFTPADINSAPYNYEASGVTKDSEVYYSRRKTSPNNVTYQYVDYINLDDASTNKFAKSGDFYYKDNANGTFVYAYGQYFEIVAANRYTENKGATQSASGSWLKITVIGRLVNETYTLFDSNFSLERSAGSDVAWYDYVEVKNYKEATPGGTKIYTLKKVANDYKECAIAENSVATASGASNVDCRNYNVVYTDSAPSSVKDADEKIIGYETLEGSATKLYMPDGEYSCNDDSHYSSPCGANVKNIKFEIFKREIILEFIDDNYTFIYGQRYDYYDGGTYASGTYTYNANTTGIFHVTADSEGDIFLCYSDLGDYLVDCTTNDDYGVTSGDTWDSIGLKFYLHSIVSDPASSSYYDTETTAHKAIPAGTYYVYAQIAQLTGANASKNTLINQNYKFTYRGGTLTIKPKVTNVQLTGYTMEYGETKYDSYGLGTNYSDYTSYKLEECMNDASYLSGSGLISDCSEVKNVVGNTYGFVVEGLDTQDTIANNFNGRPVRDSRDAATNQGKYADVGYYKINVGSIAVKKDPLSSGNSSFKECSTNLDGGIVNFSDSDAIACVWWAADNDPATASDNAVNYDISYSLEKNEGAYLFIVPAKLDIEVYPDQTKMYGCAYSIYKTDSNYYYTYNYDNGYTNCDTTTNTKVDLAYKYKVSGDKDATNSEYDVTTDQSGNRKFYIGGTEFNNANIILTDDRLYRVEYNADVTADYKYVKDNYSKYQGQAVGVYTISLGNLNIKQNSNSSMCDAYNNPSLDGTMPCRNYNINYYGNSATSDIDSHKYTDDTTVNLSDLTLYTLNYVADSTDGDYILIDGKFVNLSNLIRYNADKETVNTVGEYALIKKYATINSLQTYDKLAEYEISDACGSECYIYLDDTTKVNAGGDRISSGYVLLSALSEYRYTSASGATKSTTGDYLQITKGGSTVYIKISTITTFKKNVADSTNIFADTNGKLYKKNASSNGKYVFINGEYVQLNSLKKYKEASGLYTEDSAGTYVQIYEIAKISDLTRYSLSASAHDMYKVISGGNVAKNLYAFVDGSYVPYNSLITTSGQTTITVNSARKTDSETVVNGDVTTDVKFTITARVVYVHPEYNVKPYQQADPVEYITCDEIKTAYGLSNFTGRDGSYCGTGETKVDLGVSMYYAVQNSLAKAPWTVWTDTLVTTTNGIITQNGTEYNDIQFDVLAGKVSRRFDSTSANGATTDKAGKYTYDFANVTTNDDLSGLNYHIEYVTNKNLKNTYVKTGASSFVTLHSLLVTTCNYGDSHCIPTGVGSDNTNKVGQKISGNEFKIKIDGNGYAVSTGTSTSISLVQKYSAEDSTAKIDYWYLGFYQDDESTGRNGEESMWWDNRDVFETPYDTFKNHENNDAYVEEGTAPNIVKKFFTTAAKEVYFEIIKRTIYLYAIDVEKTYGEADKYSDFLVAICPNGDGYVIDGGQVKCKSNTAQSNAHGLGSHDKSVFVDANGFMKQWQIKNNNVSSGADYIFQGTATLQTSFGIYFRRVNGENAGSYTITACATQTGVSDCTYELPTTSTPYYQNVIGDNYEIKEISGVLTIKTRQIAITPDSDQGFVYGNYTENGSMPNITFTEARDDVTGENGLVYGSGTYLFDGETQISKIERIQNASDKYTSLYKFTIATGDNAGTYIIDGRKVIDQNTNVVVASISIETNADKQNTKTITLGSGSGAKEYTIIQKATCLINISGIYTVCISDAQNESLANSLGANYFEYYTAGEAEGVYTATVLAGNVYDGSRGDTDELRKVTISNNTKVYYSYNVYADTYSNPANEYSTSRSETAEASASNVINALNIKCSSTTGLRYSREVCDYKIVSGEISADDVLIEKETTFYIFVTKSRRYSDANGTTQVDDGNYVKYGNGLFAEIKADDMVSYMCAPQGGTGKLICEYKKDTTEGAANNYLKVTIKRNNYKINSVDETVDLKVTAAEIEVTPVEKQYKIYGEKDIEIKFTVETVFTVARTHYQKFANSNIVKICNGVDCYSGTDLGQFRYATNGATAVATNGDYILLTKGWVVTLNSYAYDEENATNKSNNLDYGVNRTKNKHDMDNSSIKAVELTQATTGATHYDRFTSYKASIDTTRILVGNLYVNDHDQTVGEKSILNGLVVAVNSLGNKNYTLSYTSKLFVIVPRPVNVEIENITKTYGQATDKVSCDNEYDEECIVGQGILISGDDNNNNTYEPNEDDNESLLVNNYRILEKSVADAVGATAVSGVLTASLNTSNYSGVQVVYMDNATDYSKMNMPIATSAALASGDNYYSYVTVVTDKYYTSSDAQERKNATLNIEVQRGVYNVARATSTCLVTISGEKCEDVGEYYLSFASGSETITKESTVANAYYNKYWGYNKNYYVVIYNNFEDSGWEEFETDEQGYKSISANDSLHYGAIIKEDGSAYEDDKYTDNANPSPSATLKIRKRAIEIVVETISEYDYEQDNDGTHLRVGTSPNYKYHLIADTNRYNKVDGKYLQNKEGAYLCSYATKNVDANCYEITSANRFNLKSKEVGEKFSIEQNMDVPELVKINNDKTAHHTTYDTTNYKNITWYHHPLQVRTGDVLSGEVAYCQDRKVLDPDVGLDGLRNLATTSCSSVSKLHYYNDDINKEGTTNFFVTMEDGYYIITREATKLYIKNGVMTSITGAQGAAYEANNYTTTFVNGLLEIDLDETPPVINIETDFIIKEANSGYMSGATIPEESNILKFLNSLTTNKCALLTSTRDIEVDADGKVTSNTPSTCDTGTVFTYENGSNKDETEAGKKPTLSYNDMMTLLRWFGLSSFDPGIMRAGNPVKGQDRYHARWYMAIQKDFNQQKTGDYTLFIYAQDDIGNISLASTVTLRIVDNTNPTVGTLNLYSAKVMCKAGENCSLEDSWVVAEAVYLPINALTKENLEAIASADKTTKYAFTGKDNDGNNVYASHPFGTYYKISAGTSAKAVKHSGWINTETGIYLTITGGDDNALTYLNTSEYTKYTISGDTITTDNTNGTHLLLGSFVHIGNLTKYRQVKLNGENEPSDGSGSVVRYMPDKAGTIIRYKGYYYNLTAIDGGLSAGYIGTGPSLDEYKLKLYSYNTLTKVYTKVTSIPEEEDIPENTKYYICDGELYQIPSEKYNAQGKHDASGTYINFAQWDHYYSRDSGNSWIKYSRDAMSGYLALGQDGQRLIMIKAIDNGYTYNATAVNKTHITDAYCLTVGSGTCSVWNKVKVEGVIIKDASGTEISYNEYVGEKQWKYNISDWETYSADGNRDRKYAYLDTIAPHTTLTDQFIEVFEYGCADISKCSNNHVELFGKAIDGYLFKLSNLEKYNSSGVVTVNGDYVKMNGELILIEDTRRFNLSGSTITQSNSGEYIYLGKTDSVIAMDQLITEKVNSRLEGTIKVYNNYTKAETTITIDTATKAEKESLAKLKANTNKLQSGVGLGTILDDDVTSDAFSGTGNAEKTFGATITVDGGTTTISAPEIADKYITMFIYADIRGGTAAVANNPYYAAQGYYKFVINPTNDSKYQILRCYATSVIKENEWCSSSTVGDEFDTMKEAAEALLSVYKAGADSKNVYNFNGNDITFTLDYRVFDIAGNASIYQRKGILFSGFTRTIGAVVDDGAAVASLSVEVAQNTNVASVLNNFYIGTTTGKNLRSSERILQSVYYNGQLVSSRAAYDLSTLETLDTSVPGEYKIVYSIERKDGLKYVEGNSVELLVTIKPNVADVSTTGTNVASIAIALGGVFAIVLASLFVELKKKQKSN